MKWSQWSSYFHEVGVDKSKPPRVVLETCEYRLVARIDYDGLGEMILETKMADAMGAKRWVSVGESAPEIAYAMTRFAKGLLEE